MNEKPILNRQLCFLVIAVAFATGMSALAQPVISTQPQSQTNLVGSLVTFSVDATGTPPLSFQWRRNGSPLAGQTNITLVLTNFQSGNAGSYTVVVTNYEGAVTSAVAFLRVLLPPGITTQPSNQVADLGGIAMFSVTATGTAPLRYQWCFNNMDLAGETNASLALQNVRHTNAGQYTIAVTNRGGAVTSQVALLRVVGAVHGFSAVRRIEDGTISLTVTGSAPALFTSYYDLYPIDASTNLVDWTRAGVLFLTSIWDDALTWSDPAATNFDRRFYRTVTNHFPTPFPAPTGPHPVGTFSRLFTDTSRTNRYNIPTNSSFMVSFWYPAEPSANHLPGAYVDLAIAQYPLWFGPYVDRAPQFKSHSLPNAPLCMGGASFPVVIFSHGANSIRSYLPEKAEELASHGFVVVAMDHIQAIISVFPDGRVVYGSFSAQPAQENGVKDVLFVLDELSRLNSNDPFFSGRLDLERIGALGSSFGGGVVGEVCRTDARCKAALFLDGALDAANNLKQFGLQKPFLCAVSSVNPGFAGWITDTRALFDRADDNAYWFQVSNTEHYMFQDWVWIDRPTVAGREASLTIRECVRAFFEKHLKNRGDPLLDNPSATLPRIINFMRK